MGHTVPYPVPIRRAEIAYVCHMLKIAIAASQFKRIDLPRSHERRSDLLVDDSNWSTFEIAPARYLLIEGTLTLSVASMVGDALLNAFVAARTRFSP